jgi:hypothetical protein
MNTIWDMLGHEVKKFSVEFDFESVVNDDR